MIKCSVREGAGEATGQFPVCVQESGRWLANGTGALYKKQILGLALPSVCDLSPQSVYKMEWAV